MRITAFSIIVLLGYFAPFWLFLIAAAAYVLMWQGYEIIVLGALIDAQFGSRFAIDGYRYVLASGALVLMATLLKPHLRFYRSE